MDTSKLEAHIENILYSGGIDVDAAKIRELALKYANTDPDDFEYFLACEDFTTW